MSVTDTARTRSSRAAPVRVRNPVVQGALQLDAAFELRVASSPIRP